MRTFTDSDTLDISLDDLDRVCGGINATQWASIKQEAAQHCPTTAAKYGSMDPSKITRGVAQKMANSCVAEMPFWEQGIARGQINSALSQAFPPKKK
jgi:hypothetical protein